MKPGLAALVLIPWLLIGCATFSKYRQANLTKSASENIWFGFYGQDEIMIAQLNKNGSVVGIDTYRTLIRKGSRVLLGKIGGTSGTDFGMMEGSGDGRYLVFGEDFNHDGMFSPNEIVRYRLVKVYGPKEGTLPYSRMEFKKVNSSKD